MSETKLAKIDPESHNLERLDDRGVPRAPNYGYGHDGGEDEVNLLDYLRAIRKRLWLVIGIAALITTLAVIYAARKPDIYEASARVQVNNENDPNYAGKSTPYIYSPINDPTYFNTQLQILSSPGLLRRVVKTLDMEHDPTFLQPQKPHSTWKTILQMAGITRREPRDPAKTRELPVTPPVAPASSGSDMAEAKRLAPYVAGLQAIKVEPVRESRAGYNKETRLIEISYQHTDPEVATRIVNAVAETYVRSNLEKRNENNASTSEFLSKRIAELQQSIRSAEERLVSYAKSNQILSLDANQNTVVERLAGLNKQLMEAENERKMAEAEYNAAKAPGAASALAEASAKDLNETQTQLATLKQKRAQLLVDATPEAPEVKEVEEQIAELQKHINDTRTHGASILLKNLETKFN